MGMWIGNELQRKLCPYSEISQIVIDAQNSDYEEVLDANDPSLLSPDDMKEAFDVLLNDKPKDTADYFRCAYKSLALSYKQAIEELESNTGKTYSELYIVGGGAKNKFLNELTEKATGKKVIALPIEATAIGNLKVQLEE